MCGSGWRNGDEIKEGMLFLPPYRHNREKQAGKGGEREGENCHISKNECLKKMIYIPSFTYE